MSDISIIIVNYGTAALTLEAVESVRARRHGGRSVDIHLVDNASPGDDAAQFAQAHKERGWGEQVTLYLEDENHGFGRGNNVALEALAARAQPPRYVFLLNPDAKLKNEAADILASRLEADAKIAIVGAAILRPSHAPVTAAFRFPSWQSEFSSNTGVGKIDRLFSKFRVALAADTGSRRVDWVSGAAFMMRFDVLQELEFFDPDFFLYFEEVELMWRSSQAGYETWYLPEAQVVHEAGAATGVQAGRQKTRAKPGYWYDSWRLFYVKTRSPSYARLTALAWLFAASINRVVRPLSGKPHNVPLHFFRDFRQHVLAPLFTGKARLARPDGKNRAPGS